VQESGTFLATLAFAVIIIFLVLAAQFESFRDPLIIMLSVPLAVSGALAFICIGFHGLSLNIYTKVGLITLVGLVTKHGILITQFANQLQREGRTKRAAVEEAAGVRLRPILMTTAAMVLGVMPLVFASGRGRGQPPAHRAHHCHGNERRHALHLVCRAHRLHHAGARSPRRTAETRRRRR
jgi:multidrug efflux pump